MMRFNWLQSTFTAARPQESQSENANLRAEVSRLMSDIEYRDAEIERLNLGFREQQTRIDANAYRMNSMSGEVERLLACVRERDVLIGELNDKIHHSESVLKTVKGQYEQLRNRMYDAIGDVKSILED